MRDFADISNASGTFPDVEAVGASGPGETDGTALTYTYLTDQFGWIQKLLNDVGMTPDDVAESSSASQILDAIKLIGRQNKVIPIMAANPLSEGLWVRSTPHKFESRSNFAALCFPLDLPHGLTIDLTVQVYVTPGAERTGTDRVSCMLYSMEYPDYIPDQIGSIVYDNGTSSIQTITVSETDLTIDNNKCYFVRIGSGDDGSSNYDFVYTVKQNIVIP